MVIFQRIILTFMALATCSVQALGDIEAIQSWIQKVQAQKIATGLPRTAILSTLVWQPVKGIKKSNGGFRTRKDLPFATLATADFNRSGFLQIPTDQELVFVWSLNQKFAISNSRDLTAKAFDILNIDSVIIPGPDNWQLLLKDEGQTSEAINAPGPKEGLDEFAIQKWAIEQLQYDGVVLDQRKDEVLVAFYPGLLETSAGQALLIADSYDKVSLRNVTKSGSGIIEIKERVGAHGIFKVLGTELPEDKIPAGTKISFERGAANAPAE